MCIRDSFLAPAFTLGGDRLARFWASGQVGPTISIGAAVTVDGTDWGALLRVETSRDECRVRLVLDDAHRDVRVRGPHDAVALAALLDAAVPNPSSAPPDAG